MLVNIGCGAVGNQNCTYFEAQETTTGSCAAKICKCQSNICQVSFKDYFATNFTFDSIFSSGWILKPLALLDLRL